MSKPKTKNAVEEQIRLHKIQEIKTYKRTLEAKIKALDEQLCVLEVEQEKQTSASPGRQRNGVETKRKETKEEKLEKQKQALEFARKMNHERRVMEDRKQRRRDEREVKIMEGIKVLHEQQIQHLGLGKGSHSVRRRQDENSKERNQSKNIFPTLETKKQDLRAKREFSRPSHKEDTNKEGVDTIEEKERKDRSNPPIRKYKSPFISQVLEQDSEHKRHETEKVLKRKNLHEKQVEYGRDVKATYLPKVSNRRKFDSDGKVMHGVVHKSQNIEGYLIRKGKVPLAGHLFQLRTKNEEAEEIQQNNKGSHRSPFRGQEVEERSQSKSVRGSHKPIEQGRVPTNGNASFTEGDEENEGSHRKFSLEGGKRGKNIKAGHGGYAGKVMAYKDQRRRGENEESVSFREELEQEHTVLKDKISSMLGDIKEMEQHIKIKGEILLKESERKIRTDEAENL